MILIENFRESQVCAVENSNWVPLQSSATWSHLSVLMDYFVITWFWGLLSLTFKTSILRWIEKIDISGGCPENCPSAQRQLHSLHKNTVAKVSAGAGRNGGLSTPFCGLSQESLTFILGCGLNICTLASQKLRLQGFEDDIGRSSELWTLWDTLVKMPMKVWKVGGQQEGGGQSVITEQCLLFYFCSKTVNTWIFNC